MPVVNNVTRLLDARKIPYTAFELPPEKLGAMETAELLQVPLETMFKTIVLRRDRSGAKPLLCVIPGTGEVDLKKVAAFLGEKKVHLTTQREAEEMTGLLAGGISPLALVNKGFQVILDESARQFDRIHVSGGQRGLNILLPVKDLIALTNARCSPITS